MKAIAGADIKVGMTVILKPGGPLFIVARIERGREISDVLYLYDAAGNMLAAFGKRWYAEVTS